jgi:hypothetical protein
MYFSGCISTEHLVSPAKVIERRKLWKVKVDSFGEDSAPGENAEDWLENVEMPGMSILPC